MCRAGSFRAAASSSARPWRRRWSANCVEEGNIACDGPPVLRSLHFNRQASRRDHVALYLIEQFSQTAPKLPDREIAEAGFFPLDALPDETTPATRRPHRGGVRRQKPSHPMW